MFFNTLLDRGHKSDDGVLVFYTLGIDIGAATAKALILDRDLKIVGHGVIRSGVDFPGAAIKVRQLALEMAGLEPEAITRAVSTGYGRKNVPFSQAAKTEIACHAKGCYFHFPEKQTIIDIGGQDNKIIKVGANGMRTSFKMNRKCAAGTGAFLEEMAARLGLDITEMDPLAQKAEETVELGSFCTVFSATEVLEKIRAGKPAEGIIKGIFTSMVKRVLEMASMEGRVVLTGGVAAHNPIVPVILSEVIGGPVCVPPLPQLTGALGAALYARGQLEE